MKASARDEAGKGDKNAGVEPSRKIKSCEVIRKITNNILPK